MGEGDRYEVHVGGNVEGQVAVGRDITQTRRDVLSAAGVNQVEIESFRLLVENVRRQIEEQADPAKRENALSKVRELEEAAVSRQPDAGGVARVRDWFSRHLPGLVGGVMSIVVHPVVGAVVRTAGEVATKEFRERFGT